MWRRRFRLRGPVLSSLSTGQVVATTLPPARGTTRPVTIRLAVGDVETAQELADRRGLPYQTFLKILLHQALEKERIAG